MFKDIDQKLACHQGIDLNSGTLILMQVLILFDHDQSTCTLSRHLNACTDQFVHCAVREPSCDIPVLAEQK